MKETRVVDRREFTTQALMLALSGVAITISGCGGGSSPAYPNPLPTSGGGNAGDKTGLISSNHGHRATVTSAMLVAGNLVELDIRGTADHTHTVTVTVDAIQAIKAGRPVATTSTSTSAHTHTVTFNSESPDPPSNY
jgi:hypothetical protein